MSSYSRQPFAAYLAPFAACMVLTALEGKLPGAVWPWASAAKLAMVIGLLWRFRGSYPKPRGTGVVPALVFGVAMGFVWIWLANFDCARFLPEAFRSIIVPTRQGFDPSTIDSPAGRAAFVIVRLAGLALVVPLMEEVFWRGFLLRWFVRDDFHTVPEGAANRTGFLAATGLFVAVHPELLAALVWALAAHLVWTRGKNLWANVAFHAGSNAALGAWILTTRSWHLW